MANWTRAAVHLQVAGMASTALFVLAVILACAATPAPEAAPPAAGAAPTGECAKDTDCKGERICNKGECQAPR